MQGAREDDSVLLASTRSSHLVATMKLLTMNFLTCARKTCKSTPAAFPLHCKDVELEIVEIDPNPLFVKNMLPRLDWPAMMTLTQEVCIFGSGGGSCLNDRLAWTARSTLRNTRCRVTHKRGRRTIAAFPRLAQIAYGDKHI